MIKSKRKKKIKDNKYLSGLMTLVVILGSWFIGFICGVLFAGV